MSNNAQIIEYNYKIPVDYNNNKEYRECFRKVFRIDTERILTEIQETYSNFETFESETKDELLFDESKVNQIMGDILTLTSFVELFKKIYKKAASFVISDSLDIGLAILLSYDYFKEFHIVLAEWFEFLESYNWNIEKLKNSEELENFIKNSTSIKKLQEYLFR